MSIPCIPIDVEDASGNYLRTVCSECGSTLEPASVIEAASEPKPKRHKKLVEVEVDDEESPTGDAEAPAEEADGDDAPDIGGEG